ncbi:hypothetical protein N7528_003150 [Penicillium herquei]|nr:hypothetical protein N7528_003150 [Penicillium herquei]
MAAVLLLGVHLRKTKRSSEPSGGIEIQVLEAGRSWTGKRAVSSMPKPVCLLTFTAAVACEMTAAAALVWSGDSADLVASEASVDFRLINPFGENGKQMVKIDGFWFSKAGWRGERDGVMGK